MTELSQAILQGGPDVIVVLVAIGASLWGLLNSGVLCFGRELAYRDQLIASLARTIDEQRVAMAAQAETGRAQATASQSALDVIRNDLLPRLAQTRGA